MSKKTTTVAPQNAAAMTKLLMQTMIEVRDKSTDSKTAAAMSRIADTTIRNIKNQMVYNKQMNYKRKITFLE